MLLQRAVELITPSSCLNCGSDGSLICANCIMELATVSVGTCVRCNRLSPEGGICKACRHYFAIKGVKVASYYDGVAKELILKLKFGRNRSGAKAAAQLVLTRIKVASEYDLVTSVPVSAGRYRERGYSQADLIAKRVARGLKLPYSSLLGRKNGEHQIGKDRKERFEQVKDAFYIQMAPQNGARILIIDDVVTTGATLDACARELKAAGAKSVWGAVVAKH